MEHPPSFSQKVACGHCGNVAPMEILCKYSEVREEDGGGGPPWDAGNVYELIKCPACCGIVLQKYFWHSVLSEDRETETELLYPVTRSQPEGLPEPIAKAFSAAQRVRNVDPNAYGVLAGRVLELVCVDRKAEGHFLGNKLDDLAKRNEIPEKLVKVANGLKDFRNVAAHAALGQLTTAEVPILEELTRAILEYVYRAPHLASMAERRLAALKNQDQDGSAS
jgi:hypothetical protein